MLTCAVVLRVAVLCGVTAPSSEVCKAEDPNGLTMRTAPCAAAPAAQSNGADVVIPQGASFQYLDRNSRQSDDCPGYGYQPSRNLGYCWVLGSYQGVTGWIPVQEKQKSMGSIWTSALCTYTEDPRSSPPPTLLVSDDGSPTGCAELSRDAPVGPECFPGDATVMLRDGTHRQLSELEVGDQVAVRRPDGAISWEPVYAFGHRDNRTVAKFVDIHVSVPVTSNNGSVKRHQAIQVGRVGSAVHWPACKAMLSTCD